jgi:hypothetical protein
METIGAQVYASRKKNYLALEGRGETSDLGGSICISADARTLGSIQTTT